jgi:3-oxoacyl-[acyl-carrier-protein] synthase-3
VLGSDGAGAELIMVPAGGSRQPSSTGPERYFTMAGQPVYRQAVDIMTKVSGHVLQLAGWPVSTVDWLVCHQANVRILDAVAGRLGIPADRCYVNMDQVGNTAAASIPLALSQASESGAFTPGDRIVLTAFGGGLTWGSTVLRWPEVVAEN